MATLNEKEKEIYKKTIKFLDNTPIHWHYDDGEYLVEEERERHFNYGYESDVLNRLKDSIEIKKMFDYGKNHNMTYDSLAYYIQNTLNSTKHGFHEIEPIPYLVIANSKWEKQVQTDSIDKAKMTTKPFSDVFRELVNSFDTKTYEAYVNYADLGNDELLFVYSEPVLRKQEIEDFLVQFNKTKAFLKQSEKDSLLLFMNLRLTAPLEWYSRFIAKEYGNYVLQKYALNDLNKLNYLHGINGFLSTNEADSIFKKQNILTKNIYFMDALRQVETEKVTFWHIRPFLFPFFVLSVVITFLLYFLSTISRNTIISSLFVWALILSCVYAFEGVNRKEVYFDGFILGLFVCTGVGINLLLFFARSKIRFIDYYISIAVFNGVFVVIRFYDGRFLSAQFKEVFSGYFDYFLPYFFYFFMLILFAYALLYKRHLNLPNKK